MMRLVALAYGVLAYVVFLLTVIYSIGFFGNLWVPRTIDSMAVVPISESLTVNLILLFGFSLQHSGMARQSFKRWLGNVIGRGQVRSTYVLASSLAMIMLMVFWQPMGGVVWSVEHHILELLLLAVYFGGWGLMFYATFLIDHLTLFGLRQVWRHSRGDSMPETRLQTPGIYRRVRHPIYLGWLLVFWASPIMTATHLLIAGGLTIYTLLGIQLEERDLQKELSDYSQYQRKVPMLLPSLRKRLLRDARH